MAAGSNAIGRYGSTVAPCQPSARVQRAVTMWSVKCTPKPGLANTSAIRSGVAGAGWGVLVNDWVM
jgi:hypothetical protein